MSLLVDSRSFPRIDLFAQVQVARESEVYIMSTTNISRGGVFIQGDPGECPDIHAGVDVDLVIFPTEDLGLPDVHLQAIVVRVVRAPAAGNPSGFGLQFRPLQPEQATALDKLLEAARTPQV